jgi:hypothetical protein
MTNDLIILNFLKEKGLGCKTDLIPLIKQLYPEHSDNGQLIAVGSKIRNVIFSLEQNHLIKQQSRLLTMIGMKSNKSEVYTLDNVYLSAEITAYGIQYLKSRNPSPTQNIYVSGNGNNVNQSFFDNSRDISIKQAINPADQPNKKNAIISFIEKFWWTFAIPLIIGLIIIAIEHILFKSD